MFTYSTQQRKYDIETITRCAKLQSRFLTYGGVFMWLYISAIVVMIGCILQAYLFMRAKRLYTKEGTPSASYNTGMLANAQICQDIVENQLDYLIGVGLDFKHGEKDSVRDSLYRIVAGKLQHT